MSYQVRMLVEVEELESVQGALQSAVVDDKVRLLAFAVEEVERAQ